MVGTMSEGTRIPGHLAEGVWTWCCFSVLSALFFQLRLFQESQNIESIKLTSVPSASDGWDPGEKPGREPSASLLPWVSCTLISTKWLSGGPMIDELLRDGTAGSLSKAFQRQKGRGICGLPISLPQLTHMMADANCDWERCQL